MVAHVLGNPGRNFQERLTKVLAGRFDIKNVGDTIMPHLTLKAPFVTDDIKSVEEIVEGLAKDRKCSNFRLNKFGHFSDKVVFLNVMESLDMKKFAFELVDSLQEMGGISFSKYEGLNIKFHSTIARTNGDNFNKIWDYLKKNPIKSDPKSRLDMMFDNIAILKKIDRTWNIHKMYFLE